MLCAGAGHSEQPDVPQVIYSAWHANWLRAVLYSRSGCPSASSESDPCLQASCQPQRRAQTHDAGDCDLRNPNAEQIRPVRATAAAPAATVGADAEFADWGSSSFGFDPPSTSRPGTACDTGMKSVSCSHLEPVQGPFHTHSFVVPSLQARPRQGRPSRQQPPPDGHAAGGRGSPGLLPPLQRGFKALIDGETYVSERERAANKGLGIDTEQPLSPEPSLLNKVLDRLSFEAVKVMTQCRLLCSM